MKTNLPERIVAQQFKVALGQFILLVLLSIYGTIWGVGVVVLMAIVTGHVWGLGAFLVWKRENSLSFKRYLHGLWLLGPMVAAFFLLGWRYGLLMTILSFLSAPVSYAGCFIDKWGENGHKPIDGLLSKPLGSGN